MLFCIHSCYYVEYENWSKLKKKKNGSKLENYDSFM